MNLKPSNRLAYNGLSHVQKLELVLSDVRQFDPTLRPPGSDGKPGGLVQFPDSDDREFIVIGDLHASKHNLKHILLDRGNLGKLQKNKAVLVFLGDLVHDDRPGKMYEMQTSIEILDVMLHLIHKYPNNVVYILGNHDTFSPQLSKQGIQQGLEFKKAVLGARGEKYTELLQDFFDSLPLFVAHPGFLATHAGPPRGGISKKELINIYQFPNLRWQLIWNRINETRSTPSLKEYCNDDIADTRRLMEYRPETLFVVGHNPMWKWGGDDSIWVNPAGTKHHIILYSNLPKKCPYISVRGTKHEIHYANLKLKKRQYVMDDYS